MRALVPTNGFTALRREMDRMFDQLWEGEPAVIPGEWTPAIDIADLNDTIVVKAEVPGIDPKEIQVTLDGQILTLTGEKKYEKEEKDEKHYRMERSMGSFARSIRLPAMVHEGQVSATFKNGLLTVRLPKSKVAKGAAIPVKYE